MQSLVRLASERDIECEAEARYSAKSYERDKIFDYSCVLGPINKKI